LRRQGIAKGIATLKPASRENMDIGSVLCLALDGAEQAVKLVEAVGTVATIAKCIYAVATKYGVGVVCKKPDGEVEIPASRVALKLIEQVLSDSADLRTASKSKA
jgi:hypothetical protein